MLAASTGSDVSSGAASERVMHRERGMIAELADTRFVDVLAVGELGAHVFGGKGHAAVGVVLRRMC